MPNPVEGLLEVYEDMVEVLLVPGLEFCFVFNPEITFIYFTLTLTDFQMQQMQELIGRCH